jgi:hypothetical protein
MPAAGHRAGGAVERQANGCAHGRPFGKVSRNRCPQVRRKRPRATSPGASSRILESDRIRVASRPRLSR